MANDEGGILPTIISRCQIVRLPLDNEIFAKQYGELPQEFLNGTWSVNDCVEYALKASKDSNLRERLDYWLVQIRQLIINNPQDKHLIEIIGYLQESQKLLKSNASSRLVLENLFFTVVKLRRIM